jgi:hypothetical protein
VPVITVTSAEPLPVQCALLVETISDKPFEDVFTLAAALTEQLLGPVTVTQYVPPDKLEMVCVVPPLLHLYRKGPMPEVIFTVADPMLVQPELVVEVEIVTLLPGYICAVAVAEHPPAPVTVTVYVPVPRPVMVWVVAPLFQR